MPRPKAYYTKDLTKVPGVTTIIGRFKESGGLINWASSVGWQQGMEGRPLDIYAGKAADIGTYIHALVESHLKDLDPPEMPKEFSQPQQQQAMDGYGAYREWERQTGLGVMSMEEPLVSEQHRFGGTIDALLSINGKLAIGDWKASNAIYADYLLQGAAYIHLFEESGDGSEINGGLHICRFGKDGGEFEHRWYPREHPALEIAWRQFLLFREAYENDRLLKKRAA